MDANVIVVHANPKRALDTYLKHKQYFLLAVIIDLAKIYKIIPLVL